MFLFMCSFPPQSTLFSGVSIGQFVLSIFKFIDFSVSLVCCYNPSTELFILATEFFFQLCNFFLVLLHRIYLFADIFYICICFNSTHNCLVKHFMLIALKYLSGLHVFPILGFGVLWLSFLIQFEIFLFHKMTNDILLEPKHFGQDIVF